VPVKFLTEKIFEVVGYVLYPRKNKKVDGLCGKVHFMEILRKETIHL